MMNAREQRKAAVKFWGLLSRTSEGRARLRAVDAPHSHTMICLPTDSAHEVFQRAEALVADEFNVVIYYPDPERVHVSSHERVSQQESDGLAIPRLDIHPDTSIEMLINAGRDLAELHAPRMQLISAAELEAARR